MKPFAAVLAIVALVFGFSILFRSGSGAHPTQAEMESILVCTTCHEPVDESVSPLAQQMKAEIRRQIAAGWSESRIENYFIAALGPQVIGVPGSSGFDLLAWLLPFGAIVFGAGAVGVGARAWLRNRDDSDTAAAARSEQSMSPNLELRVDQELARFDH
ncbi:MAG TPA: cytochrome c-type biogenesis protein CcmH [Gaiellaceae bacterium]|nr:cytochrome c-type biogenesis protein CcmH [Gaiellaceae bacterium]